MRDEISIQEIMVQPADPHGFDGDLDGGVRKVRADGGLATRLPTSRLAQKADCPAVQLDNLVFK